MYTKEEVTYLHEIYDKSKESIERLAKELNRSKKSIIGKLSKEGIYQKQIYVSKTGDLPITKKELVHQIAVGLDCSVESLSGLEKAPKQTLICLKSHVLL